MAFMKVMYLKPIIDLYVDGILSLERVSLLTAKYLREFAKKFDYDTITKIQDDYKEELKDDLLDLADKFEEEAPFIDEEGFDELLNRLYDIGDAPLYEEDGEYSNTRFAFIITTNDFHIPIKLEAFAPVLDVRNCAIVNQTLKCNLYNDFYSDVLEEVLKKHYLTRSEHEIKSFNECKKLLEPEGE